MSSGVAGDKPHRSSHSGDHRPNGFFNPGFTIFLVVSIACILLTLIAWPFLPSNRVPTCERPSVPETLQADRYFFVNKQVILIGSRRAITDVTNSIAISNNVQLVRLKSCTLGDVSPIPASFAADAQGRPLFSSTTGPVAIDLYEIEQTSALTDVVQVVNLINQAGQGDLFADPNYLLTSMTEEVPNPCTNPGANLIAAPHGTGGSPFGSGRGAQGIVPPEVPALTEDMFWNQWAFEHIGADVVMRKSFNTAKLVADGRNVRVGVFDASPYEQGVLPEDTVVDWISPPLELHVDNTIYASAVNVGPPPPPGALTTNTPPPDVSEHGRFVAGLIHAIAPRSEIYLYSVLNDQGCGDLYALVVAVNGFIDAVQSEKANLQGAVINLSLGVNKPLLMEPMTSTQVTTPPLTTQLTLQAEPKELILPEHSVTAGVAAQQLIDHYCDDELHLPPDRLAECSALIMLMLNDDIEALLITMYRAYKDRIVVVAAAGNGSWHMDMPPLGPDLPARYPFVLGVAATNSYRERACFSNWGDVFAPGGDGGPVTRTLTSTPSIAGGTPKEDYQICWVVNDKCRSGNCVTALIGLVDNGNTLYPNGYAYWSGTSFATPLVSGLAALVMQTGAQNNVWMPVQQITEAIRCGAATHDGVINIGATLFQCMLGP